MSQEEFLELIRHEQVKRNIETDTHEYWQIDWECLRQAESHLPVPRNSKEACLATQRKLLAGMNQEQPHTPDK
jgi:hypothetical protein